MGEAHAWKRALLPPDGDLAWIPGRVRTMRSTPSAGPIPIEAFLDSYPPPVRILAAELRTLVRSAEPDLIERVRAGWALIGYDVPTGRSKRYVGFIAPEREHIHLGFEVGTLMTPAARARRGRPWAPQGPVRHVAPGRRRGRHAGPGPGRRSCLDRPAVGRGTSPARGGTAARLTAPGCVGRSAAHLTGHAG